MKRIALITAALAAMVFASCTKEASEDITSYYKAYSANSEVVGFSQDNQPTLEVYAKTTDAGVDTKVTVSFRIEPSQDLVDKYNATVDAKRQAVLLPASAYTFAENTASIAAMYRKSANAKIQLQFTDDLAPMTWYVLPIVIENIEGSSYAHVAEESVTYIAVKTAKTNPGKGTKDEPYLIYDAEDLQNIDKLIATVDISSLEAFAAATPTYFKMVDDVDMAGEEWVPINGTDSYNKKIDFNGNHKSIFNLTYDGKAYGGMFGVLCGEVYDLNLIDANIKSTKDKSGILCGYMGYGDVITGYAHHCKVTGELTVDNNTIGGLCGNMVGGEIYACLVDAKITQLGNGRYYAGGIVGCGNKRPNLIHDCISMGSVTSVGDGTGYSRNAAGICGAFEVKDSEIRNCISLSAVSCNVVAGGILGHANANSWSKQDPEKVNNKVIGCIAWNESISVNNSRSSSELKKRDDYAMGAGCIMGWGCPENTLQNCWRKADINFSASFEGQESHGQPFDQADATIGTPLTGINCDYYDNWEMMYHGKAAAAGETASQVAKRIGWDESIWDLSGDIPALK